MHFVSSVVKMQTSRLQPVLKLAYYKQIVRKIAVTSNNSYVNTNKDLKSWKEIPGPSSVPIFGQLQHFLPGGELAAFASSTGLRRLFDKYGPIIRFEGLMGIEPMVFLEDPEASAQVLRSENWLPVRPGFMSLDHYRKAYKRSKGITVGTTGLLTEHGDVWKEFRSAVNPVMLQPKTIRLYCNVLDEVAMDMVKRMKADRNEKNMIQRNFDTEMNLWALESIGTVALGCRLNCLQGSLSDDSPEKELIHCIHDLFVTSDDLDFKPSIWKLFATPKYKKAMQLYERHEKLTKHFVNKGIEELKKNSGQKSEHEKGVLEKLLDINEEYAHVMASDMLFAGVDTAANTITATLYLLAINQDKQNRLREEILSKSERRPYLKACIKEGLRMMPVVSGNMRKASKEYNLMGYRIPKGMNVLFGHRDMSLREQHYPRAQKYIPERWIADKDDPLYYGNAHPFAHSPFGFGVRSCIGRRIAELEIETFLARVIEHFKVNWFGPPPKQVQTSIIYIKGPFNFVFTDVETKRSD